MSKKHEILEKWLTLKDNEGGMWKLQLLLRFAFSELTLAFMSSNEESIMVCLSCVLLLLAS